MLLLKNKKFFVILFLNVFSVCFAVVRVKNVARKPVVVMPIYSNGEGRFLYDLFVLKSMQSEKFFDVRVVEDELFLLSGINFCELRNKRYIRIWNLEDGDSYWIIPEYFCGGNGIKVI
jgi:predicted nucleotidyltransferase component of viral defense system